MTMDYQAIFARILQTVDEEAYFTPSASVEPRQRAAVGRIEDAMRASDFDASRVRALIHSLYADGAIDRVVMLSAMHVVACHPRVAEWDEAARIVGEQELAALEKGGANLQQNLAAVERHRGVLAFLRGHPEVALDYFARALERQRSAENLQNILCCLIRLGDEDEARQLVGQVRRAMPAALVEELQAAIDTDPDLALLRSEA